MRNKKTYSEGAMTRYSILGLVLFSLILSVSFAAETPTYRNGYLLVKFDETGLSSTSEIARQSIVTAAVGAASSVEKMYNIVPGLGLVKLNGTTVDDAVMSFNATSGVAYAEPVYIRKIAAVPNDPDFTDLWGMNNTGQTGGAIDADIDAPEAWDISTGKNSVIVAVTDSGIDYTHPDLTGNMWFNAAEYNGYAGIDDDNNGYVDDIYGIDTINADSDPMDDHGHGTHCAGTIGAVGNNGIGVAGVCWDVQLMALKCFDQFGNGDTATEVECIEYAIEKGAHVINASWGGFGYSQVAYDVIRKCAEKNIIFVASAGNDSWDNDSALPNYPSSYDLGNIIAVASTTDLDELSYFSNYGETSVDLAAPGSNIYSTAPGGEYQYMSGTSMAAPHVTGACALVLSINQGMGALEVKDVLMRSVDSLTTLKELCVSEGRLNINSALLYGGGDLVGPTPDPMAWEIAPVATGLHHIVMKAVKARDRSGAEYKFDCIEDDAFDSDWQTSQVYEVTGLPEGGTYTFRVIARDKSANQNMNEEWSEAISATTATGVDDLPPAPNPTRWLAFPRMYRNRIGMELVTSYDENDVEYYFDCLSVEPADPGVDPNMYDRGPLSSPEIEIPVVGDITGKEFTFQGYVRQKNGNAYETQKTSKFTVGRANDSVIREVPSTTYKTIQDAIDAANHGDTVLVHQGVHRESNIDFKGKAITVRGENPEDPAIVAATIIDCEDIWNIRVREPRRAFLFQKGEGRDSVLAGVTIKNAAAMDNATTTTSYTAATSFPGDYRQWDRGKTLRPDLVLQYDLYSNFGIPFYDNGVNVTGWYRDYIDNYAPEYSMGVIQYSISAERYDGEDAQGGAIVIGDSFWMWDHKSVPYTETEWVAYDPNYPAEGDPNLGYYDTHTLYNEYFEARQIPMPASPTIRNCVFENCLAQGQYGVDAANPGNQPETTGLNADRGGNGGHGMGGAIYVYREGAPLIKECQFVNCQAIGGNAGNGSNANNGGGHNDDDDIENEDGWDGGQGGDAGLGGCAWGGAIYFEPNCVPALYGVTISDCLVKVGEAAQGGDGGNGSEPEGDGNGGYGGNGGAGGDLRAPNSSGGAVYFGKNTIGTVVNCTFERCAVVAELSGDYSGGDGGNGAGGNGDGFVGGNGGNGGPAYFIPDKMVEIGGVDATGGTGGNGGGGGNEQGFGGNGGFRYGVPGNGRHGSTGVHFEREWGSVDSGIFPSNLYYMAYYWEDTTNLDNLLTDPNMLLDFANIFDWEPIQDDSRVINLARQKGKGYDYYATLIDYSISGIYNGGSSPFYGIVDISYTIEPNLIETYTPDNIPGWDPNTSKPSDYDPNDYIGDPNIYVPSHYYPDGDYFVDVCALSTLSPLMPNTGACAGAVYYGENSVITAANNTTIGNRSFANHGGADLFDRGCTATLQSCVYEDNDTRYEMEFEEGVVYPAGRVYENDYKFEGYGGAIFADQPKSIDCNECTFTDNQAYSGGGLYCNFAPSDPNYQPVLKLTGTTFNGNRADSHFMYSVGGGLYAGNSFYPYEEYYFNDFGTPLTNGTYDSEATVQFASSKYVDHGIIVFDYVLNTRLWDDKSEADRILEANDGTTPQKFPEYNISIIDSLFEDNVAPYGGGMAIDASVIGVNDSEFRGNAAQYGAGGYLFATNATIKGTRFHQNVGEEIESIGYLSQIGNLNVGALATGAGLYIQDSDTFLANNRFAANEVNGYAGALFINGPSVSLYPQSVINNLFVENVAGVAGGAFVSAGLSDVEMMNCTYVDNYVSDVVSGYGGAILAHDTYINVTNTIFWDNDAVWGPQLCVGDPYEEVQTYDPGYIPYTTVAVDYSDIQGGDYDVYIDWNGYPWLNYRDNNIEEDPKFIQITDPNEAIDRQFYLCEIDAGQLCDSPCKDAGIPSIDIYDPDFGDWRQVDDVTTWLKEKVGFYTTTRTDHLPDVDPPNMGFHFDSREPVVDYALTTSVYIADHYPHGTITPLLDGVLFKQGTVVTLTATPSEGYRVKRWYNTVDDSLAGEANETVVNYITMSGDREVQVEFELGVPRNLYVPEGYETIEEAVEAARTGDRIVLAPRVNQPYTITNPEGIHFGNKTLTIMSQDPDDPAIVAATIIDCQGSRYQSKRAFLFDAPDNYEPDPARKSSIAGITIKNGFTAGAIGLSGVLETGIWPPAPDQNPPMRAPSGMDAAGNGYGGAILCENGASPLIRNCVFENCLVTGGIGGDGMSGYYQGNNPPEGDWDGVSGGHSGNGIGNGYGGAIAIIDGGKPVITGCQFINNIATGGWGGISGDGGDAGGNGKNSWGGDSGYGEGDGRGGAIFVEANCDPILHNNIFKGNEARTGYVSSGGQFGTGNAYSNPWDWSDEARMGSDGYLRSYGTVAGGAVFYGEEAISELYDSEFVGNRAYMGQLTNIQYDYYTQEIERWDFTRGGAVYADPNVTLDVYSCTFDGNIGGAVYMSAGADPNFMHCDFTGNLTSDPDHDYNYDLSYMIQTYTGVEVGAENLSTFVTPSAGISIEVDAKTTVVVDDCTFVANETEGKGGAIRSESSIDIWNSLFASNTAVENGGAVYTYYHVSDPNTHTLLVDVSDCQFNKNVSTALGGVGYMKNCVLTFDDCQFTGNVANSGGALQTAECELTMLDSLLFDNEATGYIEGHKIVVEEGFGGALSLADTETVLENTRILKNRALSANASGGGICFTGGQDIYEQVFRNCVIADNSSDNIGGGIACKINADIVLNTCTIAKNAAANYGGGLYVDQISHPVVIDSIIAGNMAVEGGGIYEKPTNGMGQTDVSYTLFYNNTGGDLYDAQDSMIYSGKTDLEGKALYSNISVGDPRFKTGPLGSYYLDQNASAATSGRSNTVETLDLSDYTTDPTDPYFAEVQKDVNNNNLGYHYPVPNITTERYELRTFVSESGFGEFVPAVDGYYYHGAIVTCNVDIDGDHYLTGWSGGTSDDSSRKLENYVIMTSAKDITAMIRLRETFYVGGAGVYQEVQDAIDDAQDGDIVQIAPGIYNPGVGTSGEYYGDLVTIQLDGKILQIIGSYPEDESGIRSTVLENYQIYLNDMPKESLIEGITLRSGDMDIYGGNPTIRNCIFSECRWSGGDGVTFTGCALDGSDAGSVLGGAITILEASPTFINCIFEDNMAAGGTGGNGTNGCQDHPSGGDGGWPGRGYGGAVYVGFSSHPTFEHCTFSNNEANGGVGGNGGDGATIGGYKYHGGRGGGFEWPDSIEDDPMTWIWDDGWDGWTYGDKYDFYSLFYNKYDWDKWTKWFEWGDRFENWADFLEAYGITYTVDDDGFTVASIEAIEENPFDKYDPYWQYSGYGGAVYCGYDSSAEFQDCVFTQNMTAGGLSGVGGDRWETPNRQINLPNAGAAVYAANDSMLSFDNCKFSDNFADTSTVDIPYSFDISFGGAVAYEYDCQVTFESCDFASNQATVGGSIYARDSYTEIVDCNVFDSEAYLGGGIYLEKGIDDYDAGEIDAMITGTIIHQNRANRPEIIVEPVDPDDTTTNDEPVVPVATLDATGVGGGLMAVSSDLYMSDIAFVGNSADMSGGGLTLSGTVAEPTYVFNGLFVENSALRDGGGASVNWNSRVEFRSCTFADNDALGSQGLGYTGSGGGIYCAYNSVLKVFDSIFWQNSAENGNQITVGTGFEFDPRPAKLTIDYSSVQGYPSANAIYEASGSEAIILPDVAERLPEFERRPGARAGEHYWNYYLRPADSIDGGKSQCLDVGSTFASNLGLSDYTTSIYGARDKGVVDLGYHYERVAKTSCSLTDFVLNGKIDFYDWAEFASEWLNGPCDEGNGWCGGVDLDFNSEINVNDLMLFSGCWLASDAVPPFPNPVTWAIDPNAGLEQFDAIDMMADEVHDEWWPDSAIQYYFDCVEPAGTEYDSGWISERLFIRYNLPRQMYKYIVYAKDGSENITVLDTNLYRYVMPGQNASMPAAEWKREPYNTVINPGGPNAEIAVGMEARIYEDFPEAEILPIGYFAVYRLIKDDEIVLNLPDEITAGFQENPKFIDDAIIDGQTYTYNIQMGIAYEGSSEILPVSEFSPPVALLIAGADLEAPTPNPAMHTVGSPADWTLNTVHYVIVDAVVATDMPEDSTYGVEYKFVCLNNASFSSGATDNGPEWRNDLNVGNGVNADTADQYYPNGQLQVPQTYMARTNLLYGDYQWVIYYRDRSPNQNTTAASEAHSIDEKQTE